MKRLSVLCLFCLAGQSASGFDGITLLGSSATQASAQAAADAANRAAATAATQAATEAAARAAAASTRSAADAATRASATASTQAATDVAARAALSATTRTATDAAARTAASASTRIATDAAIRANDGAVNAAARASLQGSQRAASEVATSAAQRSSMEGAAASRADSSLHANGLLGLTSRTDTGLETRAHGEADVSTRGSLFNFDTLFNTSGKGSVGSGAALKHQSTLKSDFFTNTTTDAFDAGGRVKGETEVRTNAALATQARAQADVQADVRARLAAVDRMRDQAVETGNEAMYEQADRLEAQLRMATQTRVRADGRASGEYKSQAATIAPVSAARTRTNAEFRAGLDADVSADGNAGASADAETRVRGGFFNRFSEGRKNSQGATTNAAARSQLSGAASANAE